jgi:hypothetical protein
MTWIGHRQKPQLTSRWCTPADEKLHELPHEDFCAERVLGDEDYELEELVIEAIHLLLRRG